MGVFQSFALLGGRGRNYQKSMRRLERAQANARIASAERAIAFRKQEDPREQAGMKQTMFARGIGKSTIADQEKGRLDNIQRWKMDAANSALHIARRYKQYLKKKGKFDRINAYAGLADGILSIALNMGGGTSGPQQVAWDGGGTGGDYAGGQQYADQWGSNF